MKDYRAVKFGLVLIIISISLTGCATQRAIQGRDMLDLYSENRSLAAKDVAARIKQDLTLKQGYGYVKPYVPIMSMPEVRLVWIPDHLAEGTDRAMVAGHWIYLVIRESKFYIEEQARGPLKRELVPIKKRVEPVLEVPKKEEEAAPKEEGK